MLVKVPAFSRVVQCAVDGGLAAAAIFDVDGHPLAVAGALDADEARAIGSVVTGRLRDPELLERMLAGERVAAPLDDREVQLGIAARCVFVVAILGHGSMAAFHDDVERAISEARADFSGSPLRSGPGSGGSSSGPAELPLVEIGVTVRRGRN